MRRTFSDNWYRIADLRLGLRPGVSIRIHHYRGEPWYVLRERAHAGYFRVNLLTYRFLSRLHVDATLDEIWRTAVNEAPQDVPGQEEVFELVVALYGSNLVYVEGGVDETKILERFSRKKKKPLAARLSEMLFMRIPLWDPDRWLERNRAAIAILFTRGALALALAVVLWAAFEFVIAGSSAWNQAANILQFNNLILLYFAVFLSHLLHELAHAAVCKHFGGEVRTMGVMLLLLTPLPYVDVSASWSFRDRYHRVLVDAAGMLMDLLVGALATIVWAYTPPGTANELAYNLMFSTVLYTLLFNINPLMRFDGYYILSDLLQIPNLHEQSKRGFMRWWRAKVLRVPEGDEDGVSMGHQGALGAFFLVSSCYRLVVMFGIVLFVADQYFGVGLVVALALMLTSFILPLQQLLAPLRNPLFRYQQMRLLQRAGAAALVLLVLTLVVPVPDRRVLDGVVEARRNTPIFTESGGIVLRVAVLHGQQVQAGELLVELENPELATELSGVEAQRAQALAQEAKALTEGGIDLLPIRERLDALDAAKTAVMRQTVALTIRAPHAGIWVDSETAYKLANWVSRGAELGRVVDDTSHVFLGVIRQEAAAVLYDLQVAGTGVRIEGERDVQHNVGRVSLVPHSQKTLPSAVLSPLAGGEVPVAASDSSGRQAVEPFFMFRAEMQLDTLRGIAAPLRHGRAGWVRIRLPPRPLAVQAWRSANQYFQRRYKL